MPCPPKDPSETARGRAKLKAALKTIEREKKKGDKKENKLGLSWAKLSLVGNGAWLSSEISG